MTLKSDDNTQFARVANADGSSPLGAAAPGDGLAPLCDAQGHLIVSSGGAVINFALDRTSNADGSSPAGAQAAGTLQPALCDAHGRAITSNLTSTAAGAKTGGAAAANTLVPPLVDLHGRTIPVGLIGNPDGSNPGGAGDTFCAALRLAEASSALFTSRPPPSRRAARSVRIARRRQGEAAPPASTGYATRRVK